MYREKLDKHIADTYGTSAEYMWEKYPTFAVYRHQNSKKWFAVIMDIPKNKLSLDSSELVSVVNLKCDPLLIGSLLLEDGFHRAYHMNKDKWISVRLDGSVDFEKLKWLLDLSFELTAPKLKRNKVKK